MNGLSTYIRLTRHQIATLIHLHHAIGDPNYKPKDKPAQLVLTSSQQDQSIAVGSPAPPYSPGPARRSSTTSSSSAVLCQSPGTISTLSLSESIHSFTDIGAQSSIGSFELVAEPSDDVEDDQQTREQLEEAALLAELASFDHRGVSTLYATYF